MAIGHILVVDDEPSIGAVLAEALSEDGYTVQRCMTGDEALARSASVRASSVSMRTRPDRSLTLQIPQIPARQSKSKFTPRSSAISSTVFLAETGADLPERAKVRLAFIPASAAG